MIPPCPHGMPTPSSCLTCMEDDGLGAAPIPRVTVAYGFIAAYPGRCHRCDTDIEPGDELARLTDESIVCDRCAS